MIGFSVLLVLLSIFVAIINPTISVAMTGLAIYLLLLKIANEADHIRKAIEGERDEAQSAQTRGSV